MFCGGYCVTRAKMPSMGKMFICVWRWCVGAYMYGRHWREFLFSSRFVFVARINGKELPYVFAGNTHTLLWTRDLIELSQLECILNYSGLDQFCNWYSNLEAAGNLILMINLTRIRTIALWFWRNVLFHYHCHSLVWIHGKAQYNDTLNVLIAEERFSFSRSG